MTFTKIIFFIIAITAITFAVFGFQILRPIFEEKKVPEVASPDPVTNYLVAPYEKAKNVQQLQDNRFDTNSK